MTIQAFLRKWGTLTAPSTIDVLIDAIRNKDFRGEEGFLRIAGELREDLHGMLLVESGTSSGGKRFREQS